MCNQTYEYARHFSPTVTWTHQRNSCVGGSCKSLLRWIFVRQQLCFESCKQVFKKPSIARKGGEQHFVLKVANKFKNQALLIKKERFFIEIKFKFKKLSKLLIQEESSAMEPVNVALTDYSSLRLTLIICSLVMSKYHCIVFVLS